MKKFSEIIYNKSLEDVLCEHFKISYHMISYSPNRVILEDAGLNFKMEYIFPDLKTSHGRPLRFDFVVFDDDGKIDFLIEY